MIDQKVTEYIKTETAKGVSPDEIIKNLTQSGGWSFADIQAHFSEIARNPNTTSPNPIQTKKKVNVVGINFLIFICYYTFGLLLPKISGDDLGTLIIFYGYMVHAGALVLISIEEGIRGMVKKTKTNAGQLFLSAILLLIIGFGACTVAFTTGLMDLGL